MPKHIFFVKFDDVHKKSGKTIYRVVKDTGISRNTVKNFVDRGGHEVSILDRAVLILADYYEVDWKTCVTEIVMMEDDDTPESKTRLIA